MKKFNLVLVLVMLVVVCLGATGCNAKGVSAKSSSKRHTITLHEQWTEVNEKFEAVIAALDDGSEGLVELRIIELDEEGYPKKYEFVGFKDGKAFLVYDEDGELNN